MILMVCVLVSTAAAQEAPEKFTNLKAARHAGCRMVFLKSAQVQSCVLQGLEGNHLTLDLYDSTPSGEFFHQETFVITSWYLRAKMDFPNIFADGTYFIGVRFEGNSGTGVLQWIYLLIGWNRTRYEAALLESVDYSLSTLGDWYEWKTSMRIQPRANPRISLNFSYRSKERGHHPVSKVW